MGINSANYINGLNANDPDYNDFVADSAGHVRAIKRALKQTFAGITGAITATPGELSGFEARIAKLELNISTTVASGREHLPAAGQLTVTDLPFTPTIVFIAAVRPGSGVSGQATISFGFTDGASQFCHTHTVVPHAGGREANTRDDVATYAGRAGSGMTVGNASYTDRVAQVDFDARLTFDTFINAGFTMTHAGNNPVSTITWTAWR